MKKHIVLIASLPVLALGAVTGIALAKGFAPAEVDATSVAKGTITIDTTGGDWAANNSDGSGQNISVYFTDGTNEAWGDYVYCAYQQYLVEIPYDLSFAPTKMTAWRYSNWYSKDNWTTDPKCTGEGHAWGKWNTSYELAYSENTNIVIGSWDTDKGCNYAEIRYAYIHGSHYDGGDSGSWGTLAYLNGVKLNGSNHAEYFGDYTFVKWQAFGIKFYDSDWCVNYTLDSKITGAFKTNDGGNIECVVAGTYSLYFDRNSSSIYINDPAYALADEWAQTFLGTGDNACASVTMAGWSTFATSFGELSETARNLMADLPYVDEKAEPTTYYAKAVQRYDYVLKRYGTTSYADFMGRVESGKLSLSNGLWIDTSSNASSIWLLSAIGIIGVVTFGGLIYFSRKNKRASN